jgi:hypothetical protein
VDLDLNLLGLDPGQKDLGTPAKVDGPAGGKNKKKTAGVLYV